MCIRRALFVDILCDGPSTPGLLQLCPRGMARIFVCGCYLVMRLCGTACYFTVNRSRQRRSHRQREQVKLKEVPHQWIQGEVRSLQKQVDARRFETFASIAQRGLLCQAKPSFRWQFPYNILELKCARERVKLGVSLLDSERVMGCFQNNSINDMLRSGFVGRLVERRDGEGKRRV
ncbi:hypothetical protein H310_14652 [Aphanomyces invadans]|uniref:Uncharacterized protein n=1 Tax=Aphanomyces invadans TaxID=157072 RepID=A0A024TB87_9STRA|nr:hypothetical protein H310_14652 [Aphanomyces invadans]ETV90617.1 hypothetical protein H310_14652 [Aphanomyces invadans]|eukprot:XP_008880770.1 hypothetical protein H310_14652 [Aphanomyces invadans]